MKNLIFILIAVSFWICDCISQNRNQPVSIDSLPDAYINLGYKPYNVTFGDTLKSYSDTINIDGVVLGITSNFALCGVTCTWGTALVHLIKRPNNYNCDTVYLAVLCMYCPANEEQRFIGRSIKTQVTKLLKSDLSEGCSGIFNRFDSHGIPFYKVKEDYSFFK